MRHVITYPGFAESLSAKGLYPDLKKVFSPLNEFHMLPFYEELPNGDRAVHSIREHAKSIQTYMDGLDGEIIMLAKCGGTRPTVAMDDEHISRLSRLCLINPPWKVSKNFLLHQLQNWGATEHDDGSWTLPRRGEPGNYIVTSEYVNDVDTSDLIGRYNQIGRTAANKLFVVRALEDEMFRPIRDDKIAGAKFIDIAGADHHLTGIYRQKVIGALAMNGVLT